MAWQSQVQIGRLVGQLAVLVPAHSQVKVGKRGGQQTLPASKHRLCHGGSILFWTCALCNDNNLRPCTTRAISAKEDVAEDGLEKGEGHGKGCHSSATTHSTTFAVPHA
eukprot:646040-Amphidinium_carterae.1